MYLTALVGRAVVDDYSVVGEAFLGAYLDEQGLLGGVLVAHELGVVGEGDLAIAVGVAHEAEFGVEG